LAPAKEARVFKLLRWVVNSELADSVAGDLEEERSRRAARSPGLATLWLWRTTLAIVMFFVVRHAAAFARSILQAALRFVGGAPARDVRRAIRSLRRTPWYSLTVIGVLAMAMALASTVFAVVDGVLFKSLPFADADRLVAVQPGFQDSAVRGTPSVSPRELAAWQAAMPDAQFTGFQVSRVTSIEKPNETGLGLAIVQPGFFEVLRAHPVIGGFDATDFAGGPTVPRIVITHELWQRRFNGDRSIVGREVDADPRVGRFRIAGVMPAGFVIPGQEQAHVLMPPFGLSASPTQRSLAIVARLPADVNAKAFGERLEVVMRQLAEGQTPTPGGSRFQGPFDRATVTPLGERMTEQTRPLFRALFAGMAGLVLIACLNVSGLGAARALDRTRDIALRRAIGARSADIARDYFVEHAVLFFVGAGLGMALSVTTLRTTLAMLPGDLHLLKTPAIDLRVVGLVALATGVSLVLSSIWPIRRALRTSVLSLGFAGASAAPRTRSVGRFVVISGQVAGAMVLVVAGTLLIGSLLKVWSNDIGFQADSVAILEVSVAADGPSRFGQPAPGVAERLDRLLTDVRGVPGVVAAGAAEANVFERSHIETIGFRSVSAQQAHAVGVPVTPGFFDAAGLRIVVGRVPTDQELGAGAPVVAVSRRYAATAWPGESAIGRELSGSMELGKRLLPPHVVVGVVEDVRFGGWDLKADTDVYASYALLNSTDNAAAFVRTGAMPGRVLPEILRLAERHGPGLRIVRAAPAEAMLADTIRPRRLRAWLFGSLAVAGLVIVGVGLLGLVAMSTARRTREVGVRMALGATRPRLVRTLIREQWVPVAAGLLAGSVVGAWTVRFLASSLYELTVYDSRIWSAAVLVVSTTTLLGAWIPSLRASRINPVEALRVD
jgi:predicted permease